MSTMRDRFPRIFFGGRSTVTVNDRVAVKRLSARQDTGQVLYREAFALSRCRHIALPCLLSWSERTSTLQMTGFDGPNLEEYIRDHGPLPKRIVAQILSSIASALRHLHAAGLFHLDVKPRNLVVESRAGVVSPRLVDLGSCGGPALPLPFPTEQTKLRRLGGGAFRHCCPDQLFQRVDALGEHWDAFALGATAFFALFGRWPAQNDTSRVAKVERDYRLINRFPASETVTEIIRSLLDADAVIAARALRYLGRDQLKT